MMYIWVYLALCICVNGAAGMHLGDDFPNIEAETTEGKIKFHDWVGASWAILFSYPADYMPVSTTELAAFQESVSEFTKRDVKLIAHSCDTIDNHKGWIKDVIAYSGLSGNTLNISIIADTNKNIAVQLGMIDTDKKDVPGLPFTCRSVFIIGPDKKLKLSMLYPATAGININEILRVIDSLQLTASHQVGTPANWKSGGECMVMPTWSREDAAKLFPNHRVEALPSGKQYMKMTPQPAK